VRHRFRNFSKADYRYLRIYANDVLFVLGSPDRIVEVAVYRKIWKKECQLMDSIKKDARQAYFLCLKALNFSNLQQNHTLT